MGIVTGYLSQLVSSGIKLLNNGTAVSDNATGMVGAFGVDNYGDEAWNATSLTLHEDTLAEGYHYATLSGLAVTTDGSGGSLYFSGSGTSGRRTSLTVKT